jgi:hypothetical protein
VDVYLFVVHLSEQSTLHGHKELVGVSMGRIGAPEEREQINQDLYQGVSADEQADPGLANRDPRG